MENSKLLNLESLYEMANGDKAFLTKVAEEFELVSRETLVRLKKGLTNGDQSLIRSAVHRIKPNFSYLGMDDQAKSASVIIVKIDHGHDKKEIMNLVRNLEQDMNQALNEVEDVKSKWK